MLSLLLNVQELVPQAADAAPPSDGLRWMDLLGLGLVALFGVLGLLRGLWWQVFRLLAVAVAVAVARVVTPPLVERGLAAMPGLGRSVLWGSIWVLVFIAVLLVASLVGRLGKKSLEAVQLSTLDRAGGLVAGALTGAALHLVLVLALDQLAPRTLSAELLAGTWSRSLSSAISPAATAAYAAESPPADSAPSAPTHSEPGAPLAPSRVR